MTIREAGSGATEDFLASETSETGVYEANVVFPTAGEWNVVVESGFGDSNLTFGPATIADSPGGGIDTGLAPAAPARAGGVSRRAARGRGARHAAALGADGASALGADGTSTAPWV